MDVLPANTTQVMFHTVVTVSGQMNQEYDYCAIWDVLVRVVELVVDISLTFIKWSKHIGQILSHVTFAVCDCTVLAI